MSFLIPNRFVEDFEESSYRTELVEMISEFIRTDNKQKVLGWLRGKDNPTGEQRIRIIVFLETIDYDEGEFQKLLPFVRRLLRYFCFDFTTTQKIIENINCNERSFTRLFRGEFTGEGYENAISKYLSFLDSRHKQELEDLQRGLVDAVRNYGIGDSKISDMPSPQSSNEIVFGGVKFDLKMVIKVFTSQVEALLPLTDLLLSDTCSDDDRRSLRELIPNNGLFDLATMFNALCSKEARLNIIEKSPAFMEKRRRCNVS